MGRTSQTKTRSGYVPSRSWRCAPCPPCQTPPPIQRLTYLPESNELEVVGAPVLNVAGDILNVRVVGGGSLSPPNWQAGKATLFKPQGKLMVQTEVQAYLAANPTFALNRAVAACKLDDGVIQYVDAKPLLQQLKKGKPRFRPWIHGMYDAGDGVHCGVFHPTGACIMRSLRVPSDSAELPGVVYRFCHVCRYILVDELDPSLHGAIDQDYGLIYPEKK